MNKNSTSFETVFCDLFNDEEKLKNYLNTAFTSFIEDGDCNAFFSSLELIIKAQDTISNFADKIKMSKAGLYDVLRGRKEPKIQTVAKILKELGYSLHVA